ALSANFSGRVANVSSCPISLVGFSLLIVSPAAIDAPVQSFIIHNLIITNWSIPAKLFSRFTDPSTLPL
ncbi:hypothetical protein, partial [Yersinia pestis]|uniref:hypothetical protein n=1 Tax=Yersinia pestis TaxID=632 RepID=UPI0009AD4A85